MSILWSVYRVETLALPLGRAFCHFSSCTTTTGVTESRRQKQRKSHTGGWEKRPADVKFPSGPGSTWAAQAPWGCPSIPTLSSPTPHPEHCVVYGSLFLFLFPWGLTRTQRWSTVNEKCCTALPKAGRSLRRFCSAEGRAGPPAPQRAPAGPSWAALDAGVVFCCGERISRTVFLTMLFLSVFCFVWLVYYSSLCFYISFPGPWISLYITRYNGLQPSNVLKLEKFILSLRCHLNQTIFRPRNLSFWICNI